MKLKPSSYISKPKLEWSKSEAWTNQIATQTDFTPYIYRGLATNQIGHCKAPFALFPLISTKRLCNRYKQNATQQTCWDKEISFILCSYKASMVSTP